MNGGNSQKGFQTVKPSKRRKQKDTPSRRAADAKRLMRRIEERTAERHEVWLDAEPLPFLTERVSGDL